MAETIVGRDGSISVEFGDGASYTFNDADSWGVGPSYPDWHDYSSTIVVGRVSNGFTVERVWEQLIARPAPGALLNAGNAATGSITNTAGPGAVQHVVDPSNRIVVNITIGAGQHPDFFEHPLHPGAVVRHVLVRDGFVAIDSVGIGNFNKAGPFSVFLNNLGGDFFFGGPGPHTLELMSVPRCFPAHTRIQTSRTTSTAISALRVGDVVLAFDARADKGRGALVPRRVTRLYRNTTTDWIRLRWFDSEAKELITTPGHHFLDEFGQFPTIEEMTRTAGKRRLSASYRPSRKAESTVGFPMPSLPQEFKDAQSDRRRHSIRLQLGPPGQCRQSRGADPTGGGAGGAGGVDPVAFCLPLFLHH